MTEKTEKDTMEMWNPTNIEEALELAINAIDNGELNLGKTTLEWILQSDPENQLTCLWMACTVYDEQSKRKCYIHKQAFRFR
jgi:Tfp pilus assembly protein PilF